jgi:hypothetical protein
MKNVIIKIIRLYQKTISPDHGLIRISGAMRCRFWPSCSEYTILAIEKYGVVKGIFKGFIRIMRCNPLSRGGVDFIN